MSDFVSAKSIYCSGIGGIGVSGLARILHGLGKQVLGSDAVDSQILQELRTLGVQVFVPQDATKIPSDCQLFIYSDAVPADHPERQEAKRRGLAQLSYFEALGQLLENYENRICVSGTHGKTTTTAMAALTLMEAGMDPTVVVGSRVKQLGSNARLGKSNTIIVEACEHQAHMLQLKPTHIIVTNIEEDHLDYYNDLDHITMTFQRYINSLPSKGVFIKNADDSESAELGFDGKTITFALEEKADVKAAGITPVTGGQRFQINGHPFTLRLPGRFNVANACAVIALARTLGISDDVTAKALEQFTGTWRRFEQLGTYKDAAVISDYAHHPTAIASTLKAAREFFPQSRLVVVFQPHQRNRTRRLFQGFAQAFDTADLIIITEIYDVLGREQPEDADVSGEKLARAVEARGKYCLFAPTAERAREMIDEFSEKNDVLLFMGAGDIYRLAESLRKSK